MKAEKKLKQATAPAEKIAVSTRKRILLVDDHPMMRAGLVQLINKQPDIEAVSEAGNPTEAFAQLDKVFPDLVLSDITMPGRGGIEFVKDLLAAHPHLPILVVSMHDESIYAERMLRAGARGYIMKEAGGENLLVAIRHVLAGQVYVSPAMSLKILNNLSATKPRASHSPIQKLTDREFEIFQLIGQGKGTQEIARQLHISHKTVEVHRGHLKEKLQLSDSTALIRHAVQWISAEGKPE